MAVLTVEHLRKNFGELSVLKDISLAVAKGEVISIIGPSGSGKSTLLRCCTTLETADGGNIFYGENALCKNGKYIPPAEIRKLRKKFGLVFQSFNLFPHYSVLKNIMDAPVNVLKYPVKQAKDEALALLAKLGLSGRGDAYPYQLSGGQKQRVAIARALAMNPEILFFDEPTSALDPELTGEVLKIIRQLTEEHMTMVIVTHEIPFARSVSDHVIFMADGCVVEEGAPDEVIDSPKSERTRSFLACLEKK